LSFSLKFSLGLYLDDKNLKLFRQVLLDCLLWGSHATTFLAGVTHDVGVEPTTIILRNVVIHEAYGKFNLI
jgi:hypothetical protein